MSAFSFTYVGGPTALLELAGLRLLTDPTFDPAGKDYPTGRYALRKSIAPALSAAVLAPLDAVLLSHDHHFDNLDRAGREMLATVPKVLTTEAAAARLGARTVGLAPWTSVELGTPSGRRLWLTATPARHGPAGGDRGPVIGFVLQSSDDSDPVVYVSGDTVWYEGVAEVAKRIHVDVAVLFLGAARVREVGPAHLTFTAAEAVEAARAFGDATVIPLHYEGWGHFTEGRSEVAASFAAAGLEHRLCWPRPGVPQHFRSVHPPQLA